MKRMSRILKVLVFLVLAWSAGVQARPVDVTFVGLDGKPVKLSDYRGKFVVVNFWATWCPPCLIEIPELVMFHEAHHDKDAVVLGVNYEENDPEKVKAFIESQMISYPVVRLKGRLDGRNTPLGPLRGLPTTFMIDPEGNLVARRTGMVDQKMLEEFIRNYRKLKGKE